MCDGPHASADEMLGCHNRQHIVGESTFWREAGVDVEELLAGLARHSPKAAEIARVKRERADG